MGRSENLEKIELKNKTDQAVFDQQERIKSNLKSLDINVEGIDNESLIILNKLTSGRQDLFPKVILRKAVEELMASDPLFNEDKLDREARIDREYVEQPAFGTPEAKRAYIDELISLYPDAVKDEIMNNPNKYYTEDIFQDYAGFEKTKEQGIAQPDTRA